MQISTDVLVFPFSDPHWKRKLAVGTLIAMLGTVFFPLLWLVSGYGIAVMRRAIREGVTTLPEWDDLSGMFIDGLKHTLITLVYTLPFTLGFGCMIALMMITLFGTPALLMSDSDALAAFSGVGLWLGFTVGFAAFALASLIAIPLVFLSLVALARSVAQDRMSAAFEFGDVMKAARLGFGNFLLALVLWYVALFGLTFISNFLVYTVIGCIIYPIVYGLVLVYSSVLQGALFGIAYRSTKEEVKAKSALGRDVAPDALLSPALKDVGDMIPPAALSTAVSAPTPPPPSIHEETKPEIIDPILTETVVAEPTQPPASMVEETTAPDIPPPPAVTETVVPASGRRDDFTLINGIGPTFAQRLYAAGITTFEALAALSADELKEITKARAISNQQAWIDEAKRRAGGE